MANKKISDLTAYTTPVSGDVLPINDTANTTTKKVTLDNLFNILSTMFRIKDSSDTTKKVAFDVSGVTTATTRTLAVPDANTTIVGTDATQTLTNKTLTSPVLNLGSDAEGDTYYRNAAGALVRLARGADNYIYKMNGNVPNWEAETTVVDASTTVKGVVETSTAAELASGTATGGTGAALVVTPDIVTFSEFGNGADGSLTYDGSTTILGMAPSANVYTLTRDIYGTAITINNGVTIETGGYRIFAKTSLTNNGTIKRTPNAGGNASGITAGTAGTALASGTIYGGLAGAVGAAGGTSSGGAENGTAGTAGTAQTESIGVVGVAGGTAGTATGTTPGAGGAAGTKTDSIQGANSVIFATTLREYQGEAIKYLKGASGSGGGGSGGRESGGNGSRGAGGGSGSTGGIILIAARVLTNSGTISALGGNGGNGGNASGTGQIAGGGGGAGGSGGVVVLIYKSITLGTVTVTGGTGGSGGTGVNGGGTGNSGSTGTTGAVIHVAV